MGIDVINLVMIEFGIHDGGLHATDGTVSIRCRGCHVVTVTGHAITGNLGINPGAPVKGMFKGLENQDAAAFSYYKTIPVAVKWAGRFGWLIVAG